MTKTTFKFYAVTNESFAGAYKVGSFNEGEPILMFNMDFASTILDETPKEAQTEEFKEMILQTLTHEFCHSMQEFLNLTYDEYQVESILGAYKEDWKANDNSEKYEPSFLISDFLNFMDNDESKDLQEFKDKMNHLFMAQRNWFESDENYKK